MEPDRKDFLGTLSSLLDHGLKSPSIRPKQTDVDVFKVSTSLTNDCGWETALIYEGIVYPVERYDSEAAAMEGHARWIAKAPSVKEIRELPYGVLDGRTVKVKEHI